MVALREYHRVEEEIERRPELDGTLMKPFVLRALGQARSRPALVEQAAARFAALGLDWHAAQRRGL